MRPETVRALDELVHEDGSLVASEVIEAARDESSPLHRDFNWDDRSAADSWRLQQAYRLIGRYELEVTTKRADGERHRLLERGFQAASRAGRPAPSGTYVRVSSLTHNERTVLLQVMAREIRALEAKYRHLPEFWEAIAELNAQGREAAASG